MSIEIAPCELDPLDSSVMEAIGKLRVAAYSQCSSVVHFPDQCGLMNLIPSLVTLEF